MNIIILLGNCGMNIAVQNTTWLTGSIGLSCLSICIAIAALTISFFSFRLSRFPHVRAKFIIYSQTDHLAVPPKIDERFDAEIESWGLPIWDMRVMLEANYSEETSEDKKIGIYTVELVPVGDTPNPMNPGQVAKFRTNQIAVQNCPMLRKAGMSDLALEQVSIAVYGSGERLIRKFGSKCFPYDFTGFDTLNGKPTKRKGDRINQEDIVLRIHRTRKPFRRSS